jgi:hypothetical protein
LTLTWENAKAGNWCGKLLSFVPEIAPEIERTFKILTPKISHQSDLNISCQVLNTPKKGCSILSKIYFLSVECRNLLHVVVDYEKKKYSIINIPNQ